MNKKDRKQIKEDFEKVMDNRDLVYKLLKVFEDKHNVIPPKYASDIKFMAAYAEYKRIGGWRESLLAKALVKKAIKKAINSFGKVGYDAGELSKLGKKEREKTLAKKTVEIFKNVEKGRKDSERLKSKIRES